MRSTAGWKWLLSCGGCFALGALWGSAGLSGLWAVAPAVNPAPPPPFPMKARLGANVWMQASAEYRACCQQVYRCAELRLESLLHEARGKIVKPAVVLDLDETVLDNSSFETFLYANNLEYTQPLWDDFESKLRREVRLVPGAGDFIRKTRKLHVEVVFISNRSEQFRPITERLLKRLGIAGRDLSAHLYLKPVNGSSSKAARREAVAACYNVLLFLGDNLRDFSEAFAAPIMPKNASPAEYRNAIAARDRQVDQASCHWGIDWFVLPNPVYGEWEKLIPADPIAILHPSRMKAPRPALPRR